MRRLALRASPRSFSGSAAHTRRSSVFDPANTARNTISASLEQFLLETERLQHAKLRQMARRLSAFADLRRFVLLDVPRWRTHGGDFLYANGINDALIFGDPLGAAYLAVSHPVLNAQAAPGPTDAAGAAGADRAAWPPWRPPMPRRLPASTTRDRSG